MDDRFSRQEKIISTEVIGATNVAIIGVGAVGREVARTLACNGVGNITLYDFDTVELHNCTTQGYYEADVGRPKVDCTKEELLRINSKLNIDAVNDRWRPNKKKKFDGAFFCVDSLDMRGTLFNYFNEAVGFIADSRIGGEQIRLVNVFDEESKAHYPTTITNDAEAYADGCHVPMIKHSAGIAANMLVQSFIQYLRSGTSMLEKDRLFSLPSSDLYPI
jgi:sulfur carrier protein ThiS adenylyltransferase